MSKTKKKKKKRVNPHLIVCNRCGSSKLEVLAWVDANTDKFKGLRDDGDQEGYCNKCKDHVLITTLKEFNERDYE